jgi:hypothetical protein
MSEENRWMVRSISGDGRKYDLYPRNREEADKLFDKTSGKVLLMDRTLEVGTYVFNIIRETGY